MAYSRKAPKQDIRTIAIAQNDAKQVGPAMPHASAASAAIIVQHNPLQEIRRIGWVSIPLMLVLILASYFDTVRHWVIPFAHWILKLGS